MNQNIENSVRQMERNALTFANALENNPELQQKMAEYLAETMTADYVGKRSFEEAVCEKTIEFARSMALAAAINHNTASVNGPAPLTR